MTFELNELSVFDREIEEFLYTHEAVEDVQVRVRSVDLVVVGPVSDRGAFVVRASQVIGIPDDKYGEEVCAWIKIKKGQFATRRLWKLRPDCCLWCARFRREPFRCSPQGLLQGADRSLQGRWS